MSGRSNGRQFNELATAYSLRPAPVPPGTMLVKSFLHAPSDVVDDVNVSRVSRPE